MLKNQFQISTRKSTVTGKPSKKKARRGAQSSALVESSSDKEGTLGTALAEARANIFSLQDEVKLLKVRDNMFPGFLMKLYQLKNSVNGLEARASYLIKNLIIKVDIMPTKVYIGDAEAETEEVPIEEKKELVVADLPPNKNDVEKVDSV
ncbi:hypothetical protein BJ508DRAFT_315712 [Ascobolus immersus RN42]|uniref:Uncharacterized protein n=1 Tax=Ascobolus immersus RN42 TaxID=1160509 RepID=A0A3N4H9J6_ASCIM|nr:hypothetical protein BJ508DRAFT_315712 [Ascobolus immersus RN42]